MKKYKQIMEMLYWTDVSTDEELTNMIKYQNAYNAASRYINVITTMIDTLLNMTR